MEDSEQYLSETTVLLRRISKALPGWTVVVRCLPGGKGLTVRCKKGDLETSGELHTECLQDEDRVNAFIGILKDNIK